MPFRSAAPGCDTKEPSPSPDAEAYRTSIALLVSPSCGASNIYDPLDPVAAADPKLAGDFRAVDGKSVEDIKESNWGSWRHTSTHYFAGTQFRRVLRESIGIT